MPTFAPESLAHVTGGTWARMPQVMPCGFAHDTRSLAPGQVFVAIRTERRDGHEYLSDAQRAGASAALVARCDPAVSLPQLVVADTVAAFQAIAREHRREFRGPVIGISGSAGKTSTKNLLAALLGGEPTVLATEGNLNNHLGVPLTLTRLDPAIHRYAVIEAGISGEGEMAPLASMIEPDIGIITLVAPAHLEALGSLANVAREKARLLSAAGVAIFNKSCLDFAAFRDLTVRTMLVEPTEVVLPKEHAPDKVYFTISHRDDLTSASVAIGGLAPQVFAFPRVSDGMAHNAVLAVCAALWLGLSPEVIRRRLQPWRPSAMRGEIRRESNRLVYLDCYNANPASMADALANFYQIAPPAAPRLLVIGGMEELGEDSRRYHHDLGRMLHLRPGDFCYVIGSEAEAVRMGAIEGGNRSEQMAIASTVEPIAAHIAAFQGSVFVKGSRRHALERALGAGTH
ncbi:MAG: UDP-N-acetylmuramoyl-tripeptide--D-alanyl-D-alanine ligase [Opitutaceae bacterium]|nr:UDP-N-acetylmuramoyl-tripeptide--D-alanyl-D-alanine ligase [Opitutaceae bacterium]